MNVISFFLLNILLVWSPLSFSNDIFGQFPELNNAGVFFTEHEGDVRIAANQDTAYIPASTTKLVTAYLALNQWGSEHHFRTNFYFDEQSNTLWVKGSGDPFLISEELVLIATQLKLLGLTDIDTIGIDNSYFKANLSAPGASKSNNPYDAIPTAVAANFNTLDVKIQAGNVISAEAQTPLTFTSRKLARQHLSGTQSLRINTGFSSRTSERYFAELLATFLRRQGINVGNHITWGDIPTHTAFYTHINSRSLSEIIRPMMKYSTNFVANQLILMLSADYFQRTANFDDVHTYMNTILRDKFGWTNFVLFDGAGLSRDNRLSPNQLVELLEAFRPWKDLLPEVTTNLYAKSGTLNGISTLAGYAVNDQQKWGAFALMMTQAVQHKRRNSIAETIIKNSRFIGAASAANKP